VLARLGGLAPATPYELVRDTFREISGDGVFEEKWKKFLHDGYLAESASKAVTAEWDWNVAGPAVLAGHVAPQPSAAKLEVLFHRDYSVDDGRYTNNGWLQEMPDPITKLTWDNAVLISRKTAQELGVKNSDVVEIHLGIQPEWFFGLDISARVQQGFQQFGISSLPQFFSFEREININAADMRFFHLIH